MAQRRVSFNELNSELGPLMLQELLFIIFSMLEHFWLSQNAAEGLRRDIIKLKVWACLSQIREKGTY